MKGICVARQIRAKTPWQAASPLALQTPRIILSLRAQRGISLCRVGTAEKSKARFLATLGMTFVAVTLLNPVPRLYAATPQQTAVTGCSKDA